MTPEEIRNLIAWLRGRVRLADPQSTRVQFDPPAEEDLTARGLTPVAARRLLDAPWMEEMIGDIEETPEFAEPDDTPETVLGYARDVVSEYIFKRFEP